MKTVQKIEDFLWAVAKVMGDAGAVVVLAWVISVILLGIRVIWKAW